MSKTQGTLVLLALGVLGVLLYAVAGGFASLLGDDDPAPADDGSLLAADATPPRPVVGLEPTLRRDDADLPGPPLPQPVDLDKADRARDLHGIVVRKDGTPVAGAYVQAVYYPWRYGRLLTDGGHSLARLGPATRSARDGSFALRLAHGDHVHLRATAEGLATTEYAMLQAGERIKVVMHAAVRLIVKVRTPDNEPASGLALRIFSNARAADSIERFGTTDEDGVFVFEDLPPGGDGYLDPRPLHEGWGNPSWIRIHLPDVGEVTHELTLPPGRTLTGTVTDATTGTPIAGARVGMGWVLVPEVQTDAEGHYALPGWTGKGTSDIHVLAAGYSRAQTDVGAGAVLDFALTPGASAHGRVLDAAGEPIESAQVMAVGSERGANEQISMDDAWTDTEGRFVLSGLSRTLGHVLTVLARGHAQGLGDIPVQPEGGALDLGDITLGAPRTLTGTLASTSGEPIARVLINLRIEEPGTQGYRRGRAWERRTDDLGRFRFEDLPVAVYTVSTRPEGGPGLSKQVRVLDRDEPTEVTLVQEMLREVRIRVTGPDGKGVPGAYVHARERAGDSVQAQTDKDGLARLRLHASRATVRVGFVGDQPFALPKPVELAADQSEHTFVLEPAAITTGLLLDPAGKPLPWATLEARQDGELLATVWTDAEGRFEITTGAGAVYAIVFRGRVGASKQERYSMTQRPMEGLHEGVRAGSSNVTLRASAIVADGAITVRVVDPDGNAVDGVMVMLDPLPPVRRALRTDAEGRVKIEGLLVRATSVSLWFQSSPDRPWLAPKAQQVTPAGQDLVFRLARGATIEGTLLTPAGGPAGGGFVVALLGRETISTGRADEDGRFVVVVPADRPGPYTLRSGASTADGTEHAALREGVEPGATGITLQLAPPK